MDGKTSLIHTEIYNKGLLKDVNDTYVGEGYWTHARNAVNNSPSGDVGVLGNEPSNIACVEVPYTIIGTIYINNGKWAIYSTNDFSSEIGLFDENGCTYHTIYNDPLNQCFKFNKVYPIIGVSKYTSDCNWNLYWDDNNNPSRTMNIGKEEAWPYSPLNWEGVPYIMNDIDDGPCKDEKPTGVIDCDKLRLATITKTPCLKIQKGNGLGTLLNGSYQAVIAYSVNGIRVTDYLAISNIQALWTHDNSNGSLDIIISDIDSSYDEFELVIIGFVNQQAVARKIGYYSTQTSKISLDAVDPTLPTVPLEQIPLRTAAYEKSAGMYNVNDYLIRVSPTTYEDFNYQQLANNITASWVGVEYPADYYYKGGNKPTFLRDETYSFFIRWIYDTGAKSSSYHIPGRAPKSGELNNNSSTDHIVNFGPEQEWQVNNTATITPAFGTTEDGGIIVFKGEMAYWESTEKYPDNKPEIWGDLCAKNIRHHKMPDDIIIPNYNPISNNIIILGVEFSNIEFPVDKNNQYINSIIGYEILRGTREGNRTIIAKGLINNMREYDIPDQIAGNKTTTGLYVNYPYNFLDHDPFLGRDKATLDRPANRSVQTKGGAFRDKDKYDTTGLSNVDVTLFDGVKRDMFSFHSPETTFRNPFLSATELKVYGEVSGSVTGRFIPVENHPKDKFVTDTTAIISNLAGITLGVVAAREANGSIIDQALATTIVAAIGGTLSTATTANPAGAILGGVAGLAQTIILFSYYWMQATQNVLDTIESIGKKRQFAYQYVSHGFYNNFIKSVVGNRRREIKNSIYLDSVIQEYETNYKINNLFRANTVVLSTDRVISDPTVKDNTLFTIGHIARSQNGRPDLSAYGEVSTGNNNWRNTSEKDIWKEPEAYPQNSITSAHYAALKIKNDNQYGQLDVVRQIPVGCINLWNINKALKETSSLIFGGDMYVNRYTEKSTFFYFTQWMQDLPDNTEWDYRLYNMLPFPRYWMNTGKYYTSDLLDIIFDPNSDEILPNDYHHLDRRMTSGFLMVRFAYMYLFNSGIRDFYVESEINLAYRDYGDDPGKRHYDFKTYSNYEELFSSPYIKDINYHKYDYSLSISKHVSNFVSWGNLQTRSYDPNNLDCFTTYDSRLIYSLQQQYELRKDNWRQFLPNNYHDFISKVITIRNYGKTGAIIMLHNNSPVLFQGVETLDLNGGTKLSIGDGQLFNGQPLQNLVNVDREFEYGSCQNKFSVINTPAGLFYMSQNQGKVFSFGQGIQDISKSGMKWWFSQYSPYAILEDFPDLDPIVLDNTIIGVGCQTTYDNINEIVYFCKKDYKIKPEFKGKFTAQAQNKFLSTEYPGLIINLGDPIYFDNVSWTVSYDPKAKAFISFHDWHPDLVMASKTYYMTVKDNTIWKHNLVCDSFCKYYGVDYPFEVEYVQNQGQTVTTTRSVEYILECYKYSTNCLDYHHLLDENFDRAIVYNTEQISGDLRLNISPKNNPYLINTYPTINTNSIDILFSKEEQKYRFNQFWDITNDRGEFTGVFTPMWVTEPNGYIRNINTTYVNYNKEATERKKFRHYINKVVLKKIVSGSSKFLLKLSNNKLLASFR
jgi:hypothetical protein